ncbi:unnamed protein product [Sympodiomycopsis kandeliae]
MDEVVAYVVEELAMDGQSGTDVDRFLGFLQAFHDEQHRLDPTQPKPAVDASYGDCIWRWVSQQGTVHLGLRKASNSKEVKKDGDNEVTTARKKKNQDRDVSSKLDTVVPFAKEVARGRSLSEHAKDHGSELRIVVDEELVRVKVTGSSVKNLLAPAPYAALQLVARSREKAVTAIELGRIMGYDQKTVFYFLRRLIDVGLVAKFQAHETGTTSNLVVHRRYWALNETYIAQQTVARESAAGTANVGTNDEDGVQVVPQADEPRERAVTQGDFAEEAAEEDDDDGDDDGEGGQALSTTTNVIGKSAFHGMLAFPVMSRQRFLAFMNNAIILRKRILKLMHASQNHIVVKARLYERLGFPPSKRADRKFFLETLRKTVAKGLIEPVQVQLENGKLLPCLRLTDSGKEEVMAAMMEPKDIQAQLRQATLESQLNQAEQRYQSNITFERQVLEIAKRSNEVGSTIGDISQKFGASRKAKRHIDEYMRSCEAAAATSMPDFATFSVIEMAGRERRVRFWTRGGLLKKYTEEEATQQALASQLAELRDFDASQLSNLPAIPGGPAVDASHQPLDSTMDLVIPSKAKSASQRASQKARERKAYTNPVDPITGLPRKGRPRKSDGAPASAKALAKRKQPSPLEDTSRASKKLRPEDELASEIEMSSKQAMLSQSREVESSPALPPPSTFAREQSLEKAGQRRASNQQLDRVPEDPSSRSVPGIDGPATPPVAHTTAAGKHARAEEQGVGGASELSTLKSETNTPERKKPAPGGSGKSGRSSRASGAARIELSAERRMACFMELLMTNHGIMDDALCGRAFERFILPREGNQAETFLREVGDLREIKTRRRIQDELEKRGQVKVAITVAPRKDGGRGTQRRIVYKPDVPSEHLSAFIQAVMEGKEAIAPADAGATTRSIALGPNIGSVSMDMGQVEANDIINIIKSRPLRELIYDPNSRNLFAEVPVVRSQLYGLIPGSLARLRLLHCFLLSQFEKCKDGQGGVISQSEGIFDANWLLDNTPLEILVKYKPVSVEVPELLTALSDEALKKLPIAQQSYAIRTTLDHISEARSKKYLDGAYFHRLVALGIVEPVEQAPDGHFNAVSRVESWHSSYRVKLHRLPVASPLGDLDLAATSIKSQADVQRFWKNVHRVKETCADRVNKASVTIATPFHKLALKRLASTLPSPSSWFSHFQLVRRQQIFLTRCARENIPGHGGRILDDSDVIKRISGVSLVPVWVVEKFIRQSLPQHASETHRKGLSATSLKRRAVSAGGVEEYATKTGVTPKESRKDDTLAASSGKRSESTERGGKSQAQRPKPSRREAVLSNVQRRRQMLIAEWRSNFDEVCTRIGASDAQRVKLEDALSDLRKDYITSVDNGLTLDMIGGMVEAIAAGQAGSANSNNEQDNNKQTEDGNGQEDETHASGAAQEGQSVRRRRKRVDVAWNREKDELLRDACVILTARDRSRGFARSNWVALNQLFPDVSSAHLRQRFQKLASAVGEESYLAQLEKEWTELWQRLRGTALLPDKDPRKPDGFDLTAHVQFLRQYIDKEKALQRVEAPAHGESLVYEVADMVDGWMIRDVDNSQAQLDLVHTPDHGLTNVSREQALTQSRPVILRSPSSPGFARSAVKGESDGRTLIGIKMCLSTSPEDWKEDSAVAFCDSLGADDVEATLLSMLDSKIIKTEQREGRRIPGRNLTYTEEHRKTFDPPFALDEVNRQTFQAHADIVRKLQQDAQLEIGFDDTTGATVALAHLLADDCVEPVIDTEQLSKMRDEVTFNAKSIMDSDVEVLVSVKLRSANLSSTVADLRSLPSPPEHRLTIFRSSFDKDVEDDWKAAAKRCSGNMAAGNVVALQAALSGAGKRGISVAEALKCVGSVEAMCHICHNPLQAQGLRSVAAFITSDGNCVRVVHGSFWCDWAVKVIDSGSSQDNETWILPRAWYDIFGNVCTSQWRACLVQVCSQAALRPGISIAHLFNLIGLAWTRAEIRDAVSSAQYAGLLQKKTEGFVVESVDVNTVCEEDDIECLYPGLVHTV